MPGSGGRQVATVGVAALFLSSGGMFMAGVGAAWAGPAHHHRKPPSNGVGDTASTVAPPTRLIPPSITLPGTSSPGLGQLGPGEGHSATAPVDTTEAPATIPAGSDAAPGGLPGHAVVPVQPNVQPSTTFGPGGSSPAAGLAGISSTVGGSGASGTGTAFPSTANTGAAPSLYSPAAPASAGSSSTANGSASVGAAAPPTAGQGAADPAGPVSGTASTATTGAGAASMLPFTGFRTPAMGATGALLIAAGATMTAAAAFRRRPAL